MDVISLKTTIAGMKYYEKVHNVRFHLHGLFRFEILEILPIKLAFYYTILIQLHLNLFLSYIIQSVIVTISLLYVPNFLKIISLHSWG